MSFAPLLGPESPSYTFVQSISAYLPSLAALCTSIFTATFALADDLATRISPSWCLRCWFRNARESHLRARTKAAAPAPDHGTESYILKKLEDTDGESTRTALVFYPSTEVYALKKLEDIDLEKAIFRDVLPNSAKSVTVQLPGKTKLLREVLGDETPKTRRLKHQPSLVDGIFIIPGRTGNRTTTSTTDAREDRLPAELPATHGSVKRKQQQQPPPPPLPPPVELPADEISPVIPQAILAMPPRLVVPRPRSPSSRKVSPLLAPAPLLRMGSSAGRSSRASSMGSESIPIAYTPSH